MIHDTHGIAALWSHEETGNSWTFARDKAVAGWARANGIPWHERRQHGVERRMKTRDGWAKRWDRLMAESVAEPPRAVTPLTNIPSDPMPSAADLGWRQTASSPASPVAGFMRLISCTHFWRDAAATIAAPCQTLSKALKPARGCLRISPSAPFHA